MREKSECSNEDSYYSYLGTVYKLSTIQSRLLRLPFSSFCARSFLGMGFDRLGW